MSGSVSWNSVAKYDLDIPVDTQVRTNFKFFFFLIKNKQRSLERQKGLMRPQCKDGQSTVDQTLPTDTIKLGVKIFQNICLIVSHAFSSSIT